MNSDGNNGSLLLDFVRCGLVQLLESTGRALLGVVPYDLKVDGNLSILWNMKIDARCPDYVGPAWLIMA